MNKLQTYLVAPNQIIEHAVSLRIWYDQFISTSYHGKGISTTMEAVPQMVNYQEVRAIFIPLDGAVYTGCFVSCSFVCVRVELVFRLGLPLN